MATTGVFREEGPALFLRIMCKFAVDYYSNIEKRVLLKYRTHADPNFYPTLRRCLEVAGTWCLKTKYEEMRRIMEAYPSVPQLYEQTYVAIFKDMNPGSTFREYDVPVFDDFYPLFLAKLATDKFVVKGGLVHSADECTSSVMSLLRETFVECIQYITLKVPLTTANVGVLNGQYDKAHSQPEEDDASSESSVRSVESRILEQQSRDDTEPSPRGRKAAAPSHKSVDSTPSHKSVDSTPSHKSVDSATSHKSVDSTPSHKSVDSATSHKSVDSTPSHKSVDSTPSHKSVDSTPSHKSVDSTPSHKSGARSDAGPNNAKVVVVGPEPAPVQVMVAPEIPPPQLAPRQPAQRSEEVELLAKQLAQLQERMALLTQSAQ